MDQAPDDQSALRPAPKSKAAARRWGIAGAAVAALLLSGCQVPSFDAYKGSTTQGHAAYKLWQGFFVAGLIVFILVFILIVWAMLRYRAGKSDEIPAQTQYHRWFEIAYTVVPIVMVLVLFYFVVITENQQTALASNPSVNVVVTGFQWGWQFEYPGDKVKATGTTVRVIGAEKQDPELVLPVGKTVHITLRSSDVIHGFYVPEFDYSEYALPAQPGQYNQFDININRAGTFRGQCTQLCGLYHSFMVFRVKALEPATFKAWVQKQELNPTKPDSIASAKEQLAKGALP